MTHCSNENKQNRNRKHYRHKMLLPPSIIIKSTTETFSNDIIKWDIDILRNRLVQIATNNQEINQQEPVSTIKQRPSTRGTQHAPLPHTWPHDVINLLPTASLSIVSSNKSPSSSWRISSFEMRETRRHKKKKKKERKFDLKHYFLFLVFPLVSFRNNRNNLPADLSQTQVRCKKLRVLVPCLTKTLPK